MNENRRILILTLASDYEPALKCIHSLECVLRRDEIYRWFIKNKIVGEVLFLFFQERGFSWLKVSKDVLSYLDRDKKKLMIVGKDVI